MSRIWRKLLPGQSSEIWVHLVGDSKPRLVFRSASHLVEAPNWAVTDGLDWLCVNCDGVLYRMRLDEAADGAFANESALQPIPGQGHAGYNNDHVLSPNGKYVYASGEDKHIYRVSLAGSGTVRVTDPDDGLDARYLHGISPDGDELSFVAFHGRPQQLNVFTLSTKGGQPFQLTNSAEPHDGPEYSPHGDFIYYNAVPEGAASGHSQIFRMLRDGGAVTQVTHDERVNWFPHISPDGSWLLYLSYPPGTLGHPPNLPVELRLLQARGTSGEWERKPCDVVKLFGGQGTVNVASWAPDGSAFAYVAYPVSASTLRF